MPTSVAGPGVQAPGPPVLEGQNFTRPYRLPFEIGLFVIMLIHHFPSEFSKVTLRLRFPILPFSGRQPGGCRE